MANYASISQNKLSEPFELQVGRGHVPGHSHIFKYGFNSAIGASAETIWFQGGAYTWPSAAATLDITSSDVDDDGNPEGNGARTVRLEGLDANYEAISETVLMNGRTAVLTANQYLRLHRMYVETAGTSLTNEGVIYASTGSQTDGVPDVATTIRSTIGANEGQTLQAFYTVPAGYTAYVTQLTAASADSTNETTVTFRSREAGGAFRTKDKFIIFRGTTIIPHHVPIEFPEKTDLEVIAVGNAAPTDAAATFDIILVEN